jgi:hypothetical protein
MFDDAIRRMWHWQRGGALTQLWLTLRNLVELLARLGAYEPAAVLLGACNASTAAPPSYGPEADRLAVVVDTLVSSLGERGFAHAKARGATLAEDEVVPLAAAVIQRLLADAEA